MKMLLTLLAFVSIQTAFAGGVTDIKKGDVSISQADAEITSVREICPRIPGRMSCMAIGSVVEVKVSLGGCLDNFGGHIAKFEQVDGKGVIYFAALTIFNKASMTARCVKMPTKNVTLHIPFEGQIELVNLDYTGTVQPQY